ncbi:recombination directionality factor [Streptomyces sp. IBSNAI002]|uniref:recombination directionality factor n=1 Tax=Streptomyces sp. IBSNAI002 TaxID=3457500 RepID=UPI003FD3B4C9
MTESLARLFGTEPHQHQANGPESGQVVLGQDALRVVIDRPQSLTTYMKSWDSRGLAHHCDGRIHLSPVARAGSLCGCPSLMEERKVRARLGQGPQPVTTLLFRLADASELGLFRFRSSSWRFAEGVEETRAHLLDLDGPVLCDLAIETVEFTTGNGRRVCYQKPIVRVLGRWTCDPGTSPDTYATGTPSVPTPAPGEQAKPAVVSCH